MTDSTVDYVMSLEMPDAGPSLEGSGGFEFSDKEQAVAVGAQITEFTDAVSPEARSAISDSILLAQLAANKAAGDAQNVFRWYDKYVEVLQKIGWQIRDVDFQTQEIADKNLSMHKTIIPVLTAILAPQAAAASIVLQVLNGLEQMDDSTPWITLFDKASQHAHGAKFQVGYVDADSQGHPEINLLSLGIRANRTITQVLFFKFSTQDAELRKASGKMAIDMTRLNSAKEAIADRVNPFINEFIENLEI